ncbi:MAG: hypothetical protein K1X79_13065 [Oligoflexia bacterium]|nr:hypothetical protein [Oligoflexia bacterium]
MAAKKLKENDRVKRKNAPGCHGTIKQIREETTATTMDAKDKDSTLLVTVAWDNGTISAFGLENLEAA